MKKKQGRSIKIAEEFTPEKLIIAELINDLTQLVHKKLIATYMENDRDVFLVTPLHFIMVFVVHLLMDTVRRSMVENTTLEMRKNAIDELICNLSNSIRESWQAVEAYSAPKENMQ